MDFESEVAAGHFPSVEDAVRMAVADFKAINSDDLTWAKGMPENTKNTGSAVGIMRVTDLLPT